MEPPWGTPEAVGPDDTAVPAWGTPPVGSGPTNGPSSTAAVAQPLRRPRRSPAARRRQTWRTRLEVAALFVGMFELSVWAPVLDEYPDAGDAVEFALGVHGLAAAGAVAAGLWLLVRLAWRRVRRRYIRSATP